MQQFNPALVATFVLALVAFVFAIVPVMADAPWEGSSADASSPAHVRCVAALEQRTAAELGLPGITNDDDKRRLENVVSKAQNEIDEFC